jgi:hypothetical protein
MQTSRLLFVVLLSQESMLMLNDAVKLGMNCSVAGSHRETRSLPVTVRGQRMRLSGEQSFYQEETTMDFSPGLSTDPECCI